MSAPTPGETIAGLLFEAGAVNVSHGQPFILAAGWASPVYVDVRLLLGEPVWRRTINELAAARYRELAETFGGFDAVAGFETAGIPFAASLADAEGLKLRYVRKRPLGAGRNAQVEGGSVEALRVLLIDDLTTDGASKLAFARGLRNAGADVSHILTIFHNNAFPQAAERMSEAGLALHALANWNDVLRAEPATGLSGEDRRLVEAFLSDPVNWSMRHGGRA